MENVKSLKQDFAMAQLEVVKAQNARLNQEIALLRQKHESLIADKTANSTVQIEAKLIAFRLEDERDRMYEHLEKSKRKYNQLHEAYLQKVKRCKALEEVFNRQKTLNGLVMKSARDQKQKEVSPERRHSKNAEESTVDHLEAQLAKMQTALDEAYDVIDELEFELESVDFLEVENQRLQNELETYKKDKIKLRRASHPVEETDTAEGNYDEPHEYRQKDEVSSRYKFDSNASSLADSIVGDLDPATMERSVLTESLIRMAESESNCLRRELLQYRLQKTSRPSLRPTNSDA